MEDLKTCPFCGGTAGYFWEAGAVNLDTGETEKLTRYFVLCDDCSAVVSGWTPEEVTANWNRRAK